MNIPIKIPKTIQKKGSSNQFLRDPLNIPIKILKTIQKGSLNEFWKDPLEQYHKDPFKDPFEDPLNNDCVNLLKSPTVNKEKLSMKSTSSSFTVVNLLNF